MEGSSSKAASTWPVAVAFLGGALVLYVIAGIALQKLITFVL